MITESIDSPALAHAFNFTPQAGAGFDIALTPQLAATVAYRFRLADVPGAVSLGFRAQGLNFDAGSDNHRLKVGEILYGPMLGVRMFF